MSLAWFFISRIAAAGLTLISLLLLTRVLEPAGFGHYNMILIGATAVFSVVFGWVPGVVHRFHSAAEFDGKATAWALGAGAVTMAVMSVAGLAALPLVDPAWRLVALLGLAFCLSHAINETGLSGLRVEKMARTFALIVVLRQVIGVGLALSLVMMGYDYPGAVAGMAVGALVTGLYAVGRTAQITSIRLPHRAALKEFLHFGLPLAVVSSNAMILVLITQGILATRIDLAAVGTFAAAQTLALRTVSLPIMTLTQTSSASIFRAYEQDGEAAADRALERQFSFLMLIALPIVVPLVLANDTVAGLLFNDRFEAEVARHLPLLSLAAFLSGLQGAFFAFAFLIARKTAIQFAIMAAGVMVHAGLTVLAVDHYGAIGASYAVLASSVVSLFAYFAIGRSVRQSGIPLAELRKAAVAALALAAFCLAADRMGGMLPAILLIGLGYMAFLAALYYQKQAAIRAVFRRFGRGGAAAGR